MSITHGREDLSRNGYVSSLVSNFLDATGAGASLPTVERIGNIEVRGGDAADLTFSDQRGNMLPVDLSELRALAVDPGLEVATIGAERGLS
jgi:hypothetical protein